MAKTFGTRETIPPAASDVNEDFRRNFQTAAAPVAASSSLARAFVAHSPPPELVKSPRQKVSFER